MNFVDLNRSFVPIGKNEEADLEIGRTWGRKIANWLDWSELLEHRCVVLLAEASSGKTEEFRHQAETLLNNGKPAFFIRIEDLADDCFNVALDPSSIKAFENWHNNSYDDGWFFLDSVDEARLNHKSLERALRRFVAEIDSCMNRARIYVSCRVSDWKGQEDRIAIERLLPVWRKPSTSPTILDEEEALLAPIFDKKSHSNHSLFEEKPKFQAEELLVVQLTPLATEQRLSLAKAAGIDHPDQFASEIERNGLDALADRPGDLLDLAEYWKSKGQFGSLAEMTEHVVARKLREDDAYRPDNKDLSGDKARKGAESLSAALSLAKSFTFRAPGFAPDPALTSGALNPSDILDDWSDAERNALMRRGVFAPSTYGRLRFHHRGTQEYLMACWLDRLLAAGCQRSAVWNLIFVERYSIKTLVPSLHASAAWLAQKHEDFRDEIIQREPLVLLRHGDPRSLPLAAKERLLLTYASRHAEGKISNDSLDHRALWMFATPELSDTVRKAWTWNSREAFRIDLLRLIREGVIETCSDLARETVLAEGGRDYLRIVGLEALLACSDSAGLAAAAQMIISDPKKFGARVCKSFASILFPKYLTIEELLFLIENSPLPKADSLEGFGSELNGIWKVCPDMDRGRLLVGLSDMCLTPPFKDNYRRISEKHHDLAEDLEPIAREAIQLIRDDEIPEGLVRLLMAIERADSDRTSDNSEPSLSSLVLGNTKLLRRLFWADVDETRENSNRGEDYPTNFWHIHFNGDVLWNFEQKDLDWLFEDLTEHVEIADKQIALSAIISILKQNNEIDSNVPRLKALIAGISKLEEDLHELLTPPKQSEEESEQLEKRSMKKLAQEEKERKAKASWLQFREELMINPSVLCDPNCLQGWSAGGYRLHNLGHWLQRKSKIDYKKSAEQWWLLEEGFGLPVAEAYREGMKALWRVTLPARPKHTKGNQVTTNHLNILAFAGLGIETAQSPDWTLRLNKFEAEQAVQHACLSQQGYPDWIEELIVSHPDIVLPVLRKVLHDEWLGRYGGQSDFFSHYSYTDQPIQQSVQQILFEIITGKKSKQSFERGLKVLNRLNLSEGQKKRTAALARRRLRAAIIIEEEETVRHNLAMLFLIDPNAATLELINWLESIPPELRDACAERTLSILFGRHHSLATGTHSGLSVDSLGLLIQYTYKYIRPEDDKVHEGVSSLDSRDDAERVRDSLLNILLQKPGPDAYIVLQSLAGLPALRLRATRFMELTHGKAEQDSEPPAWTPSEMLIFERLNISPVKTGADLLHVTMGVLNDIQFSLNNADATSRPLLERAKDEDEVQQWLEEQIRLRSNGRFHTHREAHVSQEDRPDIIISSSEIQVEVAIEIKHGGKKWSVRDLENALQKQLAERYLKPETRRHGILIVSWHGNRTWRDPDTKKKLDFYALIKRLQSLAESINRNKFGSVIVRVWGIDASTKSRENWDR